MKHENVELAVSKLKQAIALHEKHMDGSAPTTGAAGMKSQMAMMEMMKDALKAIRPGRGLLELLEH